MLDKLPAELLCVIAEYLAVDVEFDHAEDGRDLNLLALRTVSKTVAAVTSDIFKRAYFTVVPVAMTRKSFQKLVDLSHHVPFRSAVRFINFYTDGLPDNAYDWDMDDLQRFRSRERDDQSFLQDQHKNCRMLTSALSRLKNVSKIVVRGFHKSLDNSCLEDYCWSSFRHRSRSAVRAIQLVIRALAASRVQIDEFGVTTYALKEEEVVTPVWAFDFPKTIADPLSPAFSSLEILRLEILCEIEDLDAPSRWTNDRAVKCLINLLSKPIKLKALSLTLYWEDVDPWPGDRLIQSFDFKSLVILKLSDFRYNEDSLVAMLTKHASTLRALNLSFIDLAIGNWSSAFTRLREKLLLRKLVLVYLKEDHRAVVFSEDLKDVPDDDQLRDRRWEGVEKIKAAISQIAEGDSYKLEEED